MNPSEIRTKDGTLYRNINGSWLAFRPDGSRYVVPEGTHTDHVTGHTTAELAGSITVIDQDGNKSTVMQ